MSRAFAAAKDLAGLSPQAFAQAKRQIRLPVRDHLERHGATTDKVVTDIWAAPETLAYIRDYVARTLKKA